MIYKLTHKGTRGCAYLLFEKEELKTLHHDFIEMRHEVEAFFKAQIPLHEYQCSTIPGPFECKQIVPKTAREKVMLFCHYYKYKNSNNLKQATYTPSQKDFNNVSKYVIQEAYLQAYFDQRDFPFTVSKSITDYIRLYNEIRRIATNGADKQKQFPNEYNPAYEKTLSPEMLSKYWQHLSQLGYVKERVGTITRWKKPDLFQ